MQFIFMMHGHMNIPAMYAVNAVTGKQGKGSTLIKFFYLTLRLNTAKELSESRRYNHVTVLIRLNKWYTNYECLYTATVTNLPLSYNASIKVSG